MTCFGHANAAINDGEGIVGLIRDESDVEFRLSIKLARIRKALNSNFVQGLKSTKHQIPSVSKLYQSTS